MMINKTEGFLTSYHNQIIIGDTLITFSNRDWCHFHGTVGKKKVKRLGVVNELVILIKVTTMNNTLLFHHHLANHIKTLSSHQFLAKHTIHIHTHTHTHNTMSFHH